MANWKQNPYLSREERCHYWTIQTQRWIAPVQPNQLLRGEQDALANLSVKQTGQMKTYVRVSQKENMWMQTLCQEMTSPDIKDRRGGTQLTSLGL